MKTFLLILLMVALLAVFGPTLVGFIISLLAVVVVPVFVVALLAGVAFAVGIALFGSTVLAVAIASAVLVLVGFSLFWPILLIALVVWIFSRNRTQTA
ncbi:hypothetical protein A28LD_1325 [Idiomarina sp. A28L]|uniref:hypothetical protein n=1 Tax=Idiomarina sp. A28L TaxID=1036674 RepID=UPI000213878F|nr:hypothetical protein [Idiomarina sp. A28L]EGN75308.1 hypothetical protein A28LD_1325 [Idiomarina sp. A28L]